LSEVVIRIEGLTKDYDIGAFGRRKLRALDDVALTVRSGDIYGFLGPNGAGKTTAVKILLGLSKPTAGHVEIFGQTDPDRVFLFSRTGYCPEDSYIFPKFSGRETLTYMGRLSGLKYPNLQTRVDETLELVGLVEAADRRVSEYSKGMKQRLSIGQTLLNRPDLVVLDEPARGLDPSARKTIRDIIVNLANAGCTVFMNSHILSEVERVCNRIGILHRGKLLREITIDELMRPERGYEVIFAAQLVDVTERLPEASPIGAEKFRIFASDVRDLALAVQKIADIPGRVISVRENRIDLEDFFLEVVEEGQ